MRAGTNTEVLDTLARRGITTAILARLDLKSETVCVWTGVEALTVTGHTDTLLNNQTFDPMVAGVLLDIGENSFTMSGSDALKITLALPSTPHHSIAAATVYPDEYQARQATLWRALKLTNALPGVPVAWAFRRIRTGAMDTLDITDDGISRTFALGIEAHASRVSQATNATYLDQKRFDPLDTSQDYAVSIANGQPAPTAGSAAVSGQGGGSIPSWKLGNEGMGLNPNGMTY